MRTALLGATALTALFLAGPRAFASDSVAEDAAQARLEQVRQDPRLASDPAAIEALARDAEMFPAGQVQIDARMVVAIAWLERLNRPDDAIAELHKIALDPLADPVTRWFARGTSMLGRPKPTRMPIASTLVSSRRSTGSFGADRSVAEPSP